MFIQIETDWKSQSFFLKVLFYKLQKNRSNYVYARVLAIWFISSQMFKMPVVTMSFKNT